MDFPIPTEFWWNTDILSSSILLQGVDQKILPYGQGRIDSVKINPSLPMRRECTTRYFAVQHHNTACMHYHEIPCKTIKYNTIHSGIIIRDVLILTLWIFTTLLTVGMYVLVFTGNRDDIFRYHNIQYTPCSLGSVLRNTALGTVLLDTLPGYWRFWKGSPESPSVRPY